MKHAWLLASPLVLALAGLTGFAALPHDGATALRPVAAESNPESNPESTVTSTAGTTSFGFWQLIAPQAVLPGKLLRARGGHEDSKGTRSDQEFFKISTTGDNDVPDAALQAYRHAEKVMATADPGCQISWTLLAAIGRVESNHGRFGGSQLGADGVSRPEIRGPRLDGAGAFAAIADSDNGTLDRDKVWDRAVGQMQFLPQTWQSVARDGDGDGAKNPDDIDDSALGSAVYLCGAGGSLADQAGMARAAFRYNHSDYYVQLVLSFAAGYQTGVFSVPTPPPPPAEKVKAKKTHQVASTKHAAAAPKPKAASPATPKPSTPSKPAVAPKPSPKPSPAPKPSPSPSPTGPRLVQVGGTWTACGPAYCLGGNHLDLGPQNTWGNAADADLDGDGTTESNGQEFAGLVGKQVNLQVDRTGSDYVVYVIGGHGFRNADGSFVRGLVASQASAAPTPAS